MYRLMYDAYASSDRVLNVNVGMPEEPWTTFLGNIVAGKKRSASQHQNRPFLLISPWMNLHIIIPELNSVLEQRYRLFI